MEKTIKEAAQMLKVETHVLRYWEDELGLDIKRNSLGHRYYDERDIEMFKNIQELKANGLMLKDIKAGISRMKKNTEAAPEEIKAPEELKMVEDNVVDFKTVQLQKTLNKMIANALRDNKDIIVSAVKNEVRDDITKQMDMLMREQEDRDEERFRRLDASIRRIQLANEEIAATRAKRWWKK